MGRNKKVPVSYNEVSKSKKSVVCLKNDELSGYIAIALGVKYYEWNVKNNSRMNCWNNLIKREFSQRLFLIFK